MDLLPLLFTTALVAYVLALGSVDLARTIIRVVSLFAAAACLVAWGIAMLSYGDWGQPVIDEFYATAYIHRRLDYELGGLVLVLGGLVPICFALFELWRLKATRPSL
ncbi:hypothetical protein [Pelagibius sp.]|uniref:hypothetical protein n=1 Tax=Pelagibius sp. TaxID=1931238 RepID=UPI003B50248F